MSKDTHSDYPNRGAAYANVARTLEPTGYVGLLASNETAYAVLHFTPKRARKLARRIIKAADAAQADLNARDN